MVEPPSTPKSPLALKTRRAISYPLRWYLGGTILLALVTWSFWPGRDGAQGVGDPPLLVGTEAEVSPSPVIDSLSLATGIEPDADAESMVRDGPEEELAGEDSGEQVGGLAGSGSPQIVERDLWRAFERAQHLVRPLTAEQKQQRWNEGVHYFADQPGQAMSTRFLDGAVRLLPDDPDLGWKLELAVVGEPEVGGAQEVRYRDGEVTQWFRNTVAGLEHGFEIDAAPELVGDEGWTSLEVPVHGGLEVRGDPASPGDLIFVDEADEAMLAYRGLRVWDAEGRDLAARMEPAQDGLRIAFDTREAAWPVTVDPVFSHVAALFSPEVADAPAYYDASGFLPADSFGGDVAMVENWAFVSNPSADDVDWRNVGAVYVFRLTGGNWQFSERLGGLYEEGDRFGGSLAVAGDQLLIGATGRGAGAVVVYELSGGHWVMTDEIDPNEGSPGFNLIQFGRNLAARDGVFAVQAQRNSSGQPLAEGVSVWVRGGGGGWSEADFVAPDDLDTSTINGDRFGSSISFNQEGTLMAVGAPAHDLQPDGATLSDVGAVYVYEIDGDDVELVTKLGPEAGLENEGLNFGRSVTIDDSNRVFVGGIGYDQSGTTWNGIVFAFESDGRDWESAGVIHPPGTAAESEDYQFGETVLAHGSHLFVATRSGAIGGSGAVFVHDIAKSRWPLVQEIGPGPGIYHSNSGYGESIAASGTNLVIGAPRRRLIGGSAGGGGVDFYEYSREQWTEFDIIDTLDGGGGARFGSQVALDGSTAVVASPSATTAEGADRGLLMVFEQVGQGWLLEAQLEVSSGPPPAPSYFDFGSSLALDGDVLVASTRASAAGTRVLLHQRGSGDWSTQVEVMRPDMDTSDRFGTSLDLFGDFLAVGAPEDLNGDGVETGSVSFYKVDSEGASTLQETLYNGEGMDGDRFGEAVALLEIDHELQAVIGAPKADSDAGTGVGAAYRFPVGKGADRPDQVMLPTDGATGDDFGDSVDVSGDWILVGAPNSASPGSPDGAAYLYQPDEGVNGEAAKLRTPVIGPAHQAPFSIAIDGNRLVLGYSGHQQLQAHVPGGVISLSGVVFMFEYAGGKWSLVRTIDHPGESYTAKFGSSVALSDGGLLVGANEDRVLMSNGDSVGSGSAFWFTLGSPRELFDGWAAATGLSGPDALPQAAPLGQTNLLLYAFATQESIWDPDYRSRADEPDQPLEVGVEVDRGTGEATIRLAFFARRDAGLVYTPQYSFSLAPGSWQTFTEEGEISYHDFNFNRHEHVQTFDETVDRVFGRVRVEFAE